MNVPRWVWVVVGLAAGAVGVAIQERAAAPAGSRVPLAERYAAFAAEVRAGMDEREAELRDALGLDGRHDAVDAHTLAPAGAGPSAVAQAAVPLEPAVPAPLEPPAAPTPIAPPAPTPARLESAAAPAPPPALPLPRTPDPNES